MTATLEPVPDVAASSAHEDSELARRLSPPMPTDRRTSWIVTLAITFFAGLLRLWDLGQPHAVSFDETYYMKDALSYLRYFVERSFVSNANDKILASDGNWRTIDVFANGPEYVVHPPVGKWTIAIGEYLFGLTPFGWRIAMAVLGTLLVLLTVRITRRLTRSTLIGAIAGFLVAIDGMAIVMSRTALLDGSLAFWALAGFGFVLLDRDRTRRILAERVRSFPDDMSAMRTLGSGLGPRTGLRPWLWAAGAALGLACGTKWSGLWFLIAFGVLAVVWDVGMRRLIGVRTQEAILGGALDGIVAFVALVGTALVVYLLSWSGWFLTDGGYYRDWAVSNPATGLAALVPDALRSLWHYHTEAYSFHTHLTSPHSYQSNAWSWLLQTRPTSFWWGGDQVQGQCGAAKCAAEVVALGNPIIWWAGLAALVHQGWRWFSRRDWRAGAVVLGFVAGWAPWLGYQGRTIFTFYSVAYVAFVAMALALSLGAILGPASAPPARRRSGAALVGGFLLLALVACWFFYPIWSGGVLTYDAWHIRMWLPTWV